MVFLAKNSIGSNLLNCFDDWHLSIKNHFFRHSLINLDFQKAFDSLVHTKIIAKLSASGIGYELLYWIESFLTGRSQMVLADGMLSCSIVVLCL